MQKIEEIWKDVKGYEGLYQVSNIGRVKRLRFTNRYTDREQERIKVLKLCKKGYLRVALFKNGKGKHVEVQRLVAIAFIPNPDNKPEVNHIDGNKKNNKVENLEWVTISENAIHSARALQKNVRRVNQYDLQDRYLATYSSITIASEITGVKQSSISNVLAKRRNKAGGYKWKYADNKE